MEALKPQCRRQTGYFLKPSRLITIPPGGDRRRLGFAAVDLPSSSEIGIKCGRMGQAAFRESFVFVYTRKAPDRPDGGSTGRGAGIPCLTPFPSRERVPPGNLADGYHAGSPMVWPCTTDRDRARPRLVLPARFGRAGRDPRYGDRPMARFFEGPRPVSRPSARESPRPRVLRALSSCALERSGENGRSAGCFGLQRQKQAPQQFSGPLMKPTSAAYVDAGQDMIAARATKRFVPTFAMPHRLLSSQSINNASALINRRMKTWSFPTAVREGHARRPAATLRVARVSCHRMGLADAGKIDFPRPTFRRPKATGRCVPPRLEMTVQNWCWRTKPTGRTLTEDSANQVMEP